jgi:hypothetical protein
LGHIKGIPVGPGDHIRQYEQHEEYNTKLEVVLAGLTVLAQIANIVGGGVEVPIVIVDRKGNKDEKRDEADNNGIVHFCSVKLFKYTT